jgi:hypothetical protein
MSKYRCWVCDTEYYDNEQQESENCCKHIKDIIKDQSLEIKKLKNELEIIRQSVPEKYTVVGSIAGTTQNYISNLELIIRLVEYLTNELNKVLSKDYFK